MSFYEALLIKLSYRRIQNILSKRFRYAVVPVNCITDEDGGILTVHFGGRKVGWRDLLQGAHGGVR